MNDPQRIFRAMEVLEPGDTIIAVVDRSIIFDRAEIAFRSRLDAYGYWHWRETNAGYLIDITKREPTHER